MELPSAPRSLQEGPSTAERLTAQQIAQIVFHPGQTIHRFLDSMSMAAGMPAAPSSEIIPPTEVLEGELQHINQVADQKARVLKATYTERENAPGRLSYFMKSRQISRREADLFRLQRAGNEIAARLQNQRDL